MSVKYLFVCAASRSGSTLLDMLLGGHSQIESMGEIDFLGKALACQERCSCGEPITSCEHWKKIFSFLHQKDGLDFVNKPYVLRTWDTWASYHYADNTQQTLLYNIARRIRHVQNLIHFNGLHKAVPIPKTLQMGLNRSFSLYDAVRTLSNKSIVVDSSKHLFKALAAYRRNPDSVRIILMVRDGRGVMYSRLYSGKATARSPEHAVKLWTRYYQRAHQQLGRWVNPEHRHLIRYEDLMANPEQQMRACLTWLNLNYEPDMLFPGHRKRHLVGGNENAKQRFSTTGIYMDERWRNHLTSHELSVFERLAGRISHQLGYKA